MSLRGSVVCAVCAGFWALAACAGDWGLKGGRFLRLQIRRSLQISNNLATTFTSDRWRWAHRPRDSAAEHIASNIQSLRVPSQPVSCLNGRLAASYDHVQSQCYRFALVLDANREQWQKRVWYPWFRRVKLLQVLDVRASSLLGAGDLDQPVSRFFG